jgi:predicted dehydrogenase
MARLQFRSGAQADLVSVWHNVLGRPSTRRIEVFMENAVFSVDHDFLGPIVMQAHAKTREELKEDEVRERYLKMVGMDEPPLRDALKHSFEDYFFLKSVIDGTACFPDFHVALEAHRIVDAVYRSAEAGGVEVALDQG